MLPSPGREAGGQATANLTAMLVSVAAVAAVAHFRFFFFEQPGLLVELSVQVAPPLIGPLIGRSR